MKTLYRNIAQVLISLSRAIILAWQRFSVLQHCQEGIGYRWAYYAKIKAILV